MKNLVIRKQLSESGVKQWELAKKLTISEFTLSRKLREELDEVTRKEYLNSIDEIAKERMM